MLKIVDSKKEKKKYTNAVETFFRLYRIKESLDNQTPESNAFAKILTAAESGQLFKEDPTKKEILKLHLLEDLPLPVTAKRLGFSTSHVYNLYRDIIKDLAMLMFEVIML